MDDTRGEGRQHMERSALYFPATCPAIYRVPNEILRKIFSHITNFGPCGLEDLINASHVCHLWRVLALQTKELWTDITLSFAGGSVARQAQEAGLALERSKPLPITVHISNPPSAPELGNYRELVLRALRELPRVRVLCISSFETTEPDEFFDSITQILQTHPAPLLEELRFDHIPDDISSGNLFAGQVPPKLRKLDIVACFVHPIIVRASLTHLDLIYTDMDDILNILRGLPSLEHLGLTPEPAMAEIESLSFPAVHLPNLRNVAITGYCGLITRFMRYLDFAVDVDIHFQLLCERVIDFSYLSELSWICDGRFSKIFAAGLYQDLSITSLDEEYYTIMLCNPLPPSGKDPRLPQIITVSFVEGNLLSEDTGLVTPLLSFLPAVRSIRTLTADSLPLRFLREWESLSERLPDVVSINVSGISAHGLAIALNSDGALFPHLTTLSIENVSFTGSVDEQPPTLAYVRRLSGLWGSAPASDAEEESEMETTSEKKMASPWVASVSLFEVLLKGLRARDAASLPVDKISIRKCDVTAGMVAQLRALLGADCVESDGKEDVGPRPQM